MLKFQLASYDIVSNLTSRNISDYLMTTTKDFSKRRYGGFEFGVGNPLAGLNITLLEEFLYGFLNVSQVGSFRFLRFQMIFRKEKITFTSKISAFLYPK